MITATIAAALAAFAALAAACRLAGRRCTRIDRDAYERARSEWAAYRQAARSEEKGA